MRAQDGPAVQIVTAGSPGSGGGPAFMPLERLPVGISLSTSVGYDTNVGTSSGNERPSFYSSAGVNVSYSFGTERTRASFNWAVGTSYYSDGVNGSFGHYEPDSSLNTTISHLVSERLSLSASIHAKYSQEPDFAAALGENRRSGNYFSTSDSISASYQWLERFSTVTSYSIGIISYEDEPLSTALNRYDHSISQQFRFLLLPLTTVFGQYGFSTALYDSGNRNSYSHVFSVGIDQTLGPRLHGSLSAGGQLYS
ncbi:MAG: transporter, partial [Verrucomicrobiota bacterium]|nr:transporter [Verrucomicrobiota bacterium]